MEPLIRVAIVVAVAFGITVPAPASAAPAAKVTCATVKKAFPNGVAASSASARAFAASTGVRVPVNRVAFKRFAVLDRDRDGIVCPRVPTTPPVSQTPTLAPGDAATLRKPGECRITTQDATRTVSIGFDRPAGRTPTQGSPRATVLLVDFPNAPAAESASDRYNAIVPSAVGFLNAASYGRLSIQPEPYLTWVRMPRTTAEYGLARGVSFVQHKAYIEDAIAAADANVDFSRSDLVIVMTAGNAPDMGNSPAFTPFRGGGVVADGRTIDNGVTLGTDFAGRQDRVLAHELLHTLGLVDLYSFADPSQQFTFTGPYSVMGDVTTTLPGPTAWERWVLGWIDDRQVACVGTGESTVTLEPVSRAGSGVKAVVVPRGDGPAVVVEARSAESIDAGGPSGVVVYSVDPHVGSGYGPVRMARDGGGVMAPLQAGQSVTVSGVTVTVVSGGSNPQVKVVAG